MNLGILYKPTNEYVSFKDGDKVVLFTKNEDIVNEALNILVQASEGDNDFALVSVDYPGDGNQYTDGEDFVYVSASLVAD